MTKAKIIEAIQKKEAELWLEFNEHSYHYAPKAQGYLAVLNWESEDDLAIRYRARWAVLHELMEEIGIEAADNEINKQAWKYNSLTFKNSKETA